jgi:hypothetical protein
MPQSRDVAKVPGDPDAKRVRSPAGATELPPDVAVFEEMIL